MRLRGRKGIREELEALPQIVVLDASELKGNWSRFFGNEKPIHVELGMGKGRFISRHSVLNPNINFIGVDMYDELIRRGAEKALEARSELGLEGYPPNLALLRANIEGIGDIFAPGEIERIYLNFSDPWPKSKHARRRLTHPRFLEQYAIILNEYGEIHQKTDSRLLFEFSLNSYAQTELQLRNISLDLHRDEVREDLVLTEYEGKFIQQGMPIYRCEAVIGAKALTAYREEKSQLRSREAAKESEDAMKAKQHAGRPLGTGHEHTEE